jgi:hypothetical protein
VRVECLDLDDLDGCLGLDCSANLDRQPYVEHHNNDDGAAS